MPLRFPRPVVPVIATGLAALWVAVASTPALADQVRQQEWWLGKLNVTQAWQGSKGHGVLVAVLSDGIDPEQSDLAGSVTVGPDYTNSHETIPTYIGIQGTAIASLIAGHGHGAGDDSGIVGIAPQAKILSVRVTLDPNDPALDSTATGAGLPDAIAAGIRYAVAQHAKVIDLPLDPGQPSPAALAAIPGVPIGGTPPETAGITAAAGGSTIEQQAVAYALHRGVVLVAPAGDNAESSDATNYPAAYPGVISVGAFGDTLVKAAYSSRLPYVDITAPGDGVTAATASSYTELRSTTAASAMVAGVAALIRSRFPRLTPVQVSHALTTSTLYRRAGGRKAGSGYGTVNAQRALAAAAALAATGADRAGAGAVARIEPAAPAATPAQAPRSVAPRVLRAAIVSAGLLIVLLLLIAGYAALGRRRARTGSRAPAAARAAAATYAAPVAFAGSRPTDADRMLEAFAVPAGGPPAASGPFGSLSGAQLTAGQHSAAQHAAAQHSAAQHAAAQRSAAQLTAAQLATQAADPGAGTAGSVAGRHAAGGGEDSGGQAAAAWAPLGPAGRGDIGRPRVSGTPPWEPAARPDSELPWVAGPGSGRASAAIGGMRAASAGLAGALGAGGGAGSAGPADPAPSAAQQATAEHSATASQQGTTAQQGATGQHVVAEYQTAAEYQAAAEFPAVAQTTAGGTDRAAQPGPEPEPAWPGASAALPPAPSPSGGAWEDFTDTNMRAIPAAGDITGQFAALGGSPAGSGPAPGGPVPGEPTADSWAASGPAAGGWTANNRASGAPWDIPAGPPAMSGAPWDVQDADQGTGTGAPWPAAFAPDHTGSATDASSQPPPAGSESNVGQGGTGEDDPGAGLQWLPSAASDQWQPSTGQHWQPAQQDAPWSADTGWQQPAQLSGEYSEQPSGQYGQQASSHFGQPTAEQYGEQPPEQYSQPTPGQYSQPSPGQYDQQPAGQYGQRATGQDDQLDSLRQSARESAAPPPLATGQPPWEPSVSPSLSWLPGAAQTPWDPSGGRQAGGQQASGPEAADLGAGIPQASESQPSQPEPGEGQPGGQQPGGPPWGPATDQGWNQGGQQSSWDEPRWEEPRWEEPRWDRVPDAHWEPTAPGGDAASSDDQGWRPGARTETFPAITDD